MKWIWTIFENDLLYQIFIFMYSAILNIILIYVNQLFY
jgi:hypothetical protein